MRTWTALIGTLVALCCAAPALAAEGDLDPTFGASGRVAFSAGQTPQENAVIADDQGRIIVVGTAVLADNFDMTVARFMPNGAPDTSFSGDGFASFDFPAANDIDNARAVAVDAQGGILLAGATSAGGQNVALIRVKSDGSQDTSFGPPGSNGFVTKDLNGGQDAATALALDTQGRIVVGGYGEFGGDADFAAVRFSSSGQLDTTFGAGGQRTVDFTSSGGDDDFANAMTLDPQGRIVLAGASDTGSGEDFAVARLTSDGERDPSFGTSSDPTHAGQVTTPFGPDGETANAVTIDHEGRIVAAGRAEVNGLAFGFAAARYNQDGTLDASFGSGGKVTLPPIEGDAGTGDLAASVAIDAQDRPVLIGRAKNPLGGTDFAVVRYTPSGTLDSTFGGLGVVTAANGIGAGGLIDDHARILAAGRFDPGGGAQLQFGLARFIGDAVAPVISITSGPADGAVISDSTPTFAFGSNEAGSTFACGFDGLSTGCASSFAPLGPIGDGKHTFSLTATDAAGNTSAPTTRTFTVDTKAPDIDISGKKKVKTHRKKARDKLEIETSEPAELICQVDQRAPVDCSAKFITPKLRRGKHKVTVTATDQAGNSSDEKKKVKVVQKP